MIEFNGYLTDSAQKHFFARSRKLSLYVSLGSVALILPGVLAISVKTGLWILFLLFCSTLVAIVIAAFIPKSKKTKKQLIPKRIFTEDEYIISVTDTAEDFKKISDVKKVKKYNDFYELSFPFGKISDKFICQKSLLSKGTLEEFEALFEGKIEIMNK